MAGTKVSPNRPLVVVLGPTAVGKTGLALRIAERFEGEIVGADSRQIYRLMDIGTAKPTTDEQRRVPHHLIDVVNPDENLGLADYQHLAYTAINAIHARGRLPLLVGGTGQYLTAVTEGWSIPEVPPNPALRAELEHLAQQQGALALHNALQQVDPAAAAKIHPNNVRRTIRALEVFRETGTPISILQRKQPPPYRIFQIGLRMSRDLLYEQADRRLDMMLLGGFVEEVRRLLDLGYDRSLPSMTALGYRELSAHLLDGLALDAAVTASKIATHDFIRRQETWFSGHDQGILWHNIQELAGNSLAAKLQHWLNEGAA